MRTPYRSTVPLLALMKSEWSTLRKVLGACQAPMPADLHFEFKVDHQSKGRGTPSHTDVMAIFGNVCIAIESKWTEPPYDTVGIWLSKGADISNRERVLKGWLALMRLECMPQSLEEIADCEYQMPHRAASACAAASSSAARKRPMLAYLKFTSPRMPASAASTEYYISALTLLHKRLRPKDLQTVLVEMEITPSDLFRLIADLPKTSHATGIAVRSALQEASLFNFVNNKVYPIGT
ncbi:hypothetical protein M2241_002748 [Bradyrhizobium elkanii]|uniref:DUF6946 family protein n=1 Tax=Bradyrhizobium elkanii TaxID=29448 RepID=UPI0022277CCA|nr:hypothetical protein [Bradyrhizobium elkanii]MCW2209821.1 hypothetical protein [Bradyrhizobium elkanii]